MGCSYDPLALTTDAPVDVPGPQMRDFDADGIPDNADHCPHINNPSNNDSDNDGVGDDCDPRPSVPGDMRIAFYGFADPTEIDDWVQSNGVWQITGNRMVQTEMAGLATIELPMLTGGVHVETAFEVDQLASGVDAEIGTCSGNTGSTQHYCCDVIRKATGTTNGELWAQWPGMPLSIDQQPWTGGFATGSLIEIENDLVATMRNCTVRQTNPTVNRPLVKSEAGPIDGTVELYMKNATAKYRYIFVSSIGG